MPNLNYTRSRSKEQELVNKYKKDGWFSTRTPGSKTPVDVLALKPTNCGHPSHFEVVFHQFKVSENRVNAKETVKVEDIPFPVNILWHMLPVKSKKWLGERKAAKIKKSVLRPKKLSAKG